MRKIRYSKKVTTSEHFVTNSLKVFGFNKRDENKRIKTRNFQRFHFFRGSNP